MSGFGEQDYTRQYLLAFEGGIETGTHWGLRADLSDDSGGPNNDAFNGVESDDLKDNREYQVYLTTPAKIETACNDGIDDDSDGLTDCDDPDCNNDPACTSQLTHAMSRRTHGIAGVCNLTIPFDGVLIESRQNGTAPQMVLTYDQPPTDPGCTGITVAGGTCNATSVVGNDLIIDITFDVNACAEVTVGDDTLQVLTHTGNVNGDANVNVIDLQDVKNHLFQPVDSGNCVYDVNCDGQLNVIDLQETKNNIFQPAGCD